MEILKLLRGNICMCQPYASKHLSKLFKPHTFHQFSRAVYVVCNYSLFYSALFALRADLYICVHAFKCVGICVCVCFFFHPLILAVCWMSNKRMEESVLCMRYHSDTKVYILRTSSLFLLRNPLLDPKKYTYNMI